MGEREVTVQMEELMEWAGRHQPNPREKLAAESLVSFRVVCDLFRGIAPKLPRTRIQMARAMEKPVESLFQPVKKAG